MKKKIAILGSTGSIGKSLLKIISRNKKKYEIVLLTANKDYKTLLKQAQKFSVKNLILTNEKSLGILQKKTKKNNIKIYSSYDQLNKIFNKKIDYTMSAITGIDGLYPTTKIIKYTKVIAIANKESIICGWNIIINKLKKYKTEFIPVDSEHFSIWYGLTKNKTENVEKIYLTASGGSLNKIPVNKLEKITVKEALKHPNWKMGKKITIDSATMMNKLFEVIEAKNIFNVPYKKINILLHPKSYVHAIIKFKSGMIKIIAHDTTMEIPIFNSLINSVNDFKLNSKKLNIKTLNRLDFDTINVKKYPLIKLLNHLPNNHSLFETVIVSANDTLANLFLNKKINFKDIEKKLFQIVKMKEFIKFKKIRPNKIEEILKLNNYVRLKIIKKVYTS